MTYCACPDPKPVVVTDETFGAADELLAAVTYQQCARCGRPIDLQPELDGVYPLPDDFPDDPDGIISPGA